jgi:glycosyltransferase involved in cell wall biosynthesis
MKAQGNRKISLVSTVLNDRAGCVAFRVQMLAQTTKPDEIVIVDGGSSDGTWEILQEFSGSDQELKWLVFQENGCNVARGRNLAIIRASHDLIVSTDIGCEWEKEWLEELIDPMLKDTSIEAVMGSWEIDVATLKDWGLVEAAWLNSTQFIATPQAHASSRSIAYTRDLWSRIGGYPEDLTLAADDMVYAILLHKNTQKTAAATIPRVKWERHTSLKSYTKEAKRNFLGAGEAGLWLKDFALVGLRFLVEILFALSGLIALLMGLLLIGIILLSFSVLLILLRVCKLRHATKRLTALGENNVLMKILAFEYFSKWAGLYGYAFGYINGSKKCRECRSRIKSN